MTEEDSTNSQKSEPKKNFFNKVADFGKRIYAFAKKISPQIRDLDNAINSRDPIAITSTILNEGSNIINGKKGRMLYSAHNTIELLNSDNINSDKIYNAASIGADLVSNNTNLEGPERDFIKKISHGLSKVPEQKKIYDGIENSVNKSIEDARNQYFYTLEQKEENKNKDDKIIAAMKTAFEESNGTQPPITSHFTTENNHQPSDSLHKEIGNLRTTTTSTDNSKQSPSKKNELHKLISMNIQKSR